MTRADAPLLFAELPAQRAPLESYVNLHALVPHLMELYSDWQEHDLVRFLEEKTGRRLHPEDGTTLRALYQRCVALRLEFEEAFPRGGGARTSVDPGARVPVSSSG